VARRNPARKDATTTVNAVLFVAFREPMSRDQLEATTLRLQEVMDKHARDAEGASASANFETSEVEIDLSVVGVSMSVVHEKIASVVRALEVHGGIDPRTLAPSSSAGAASAPEMRVRSSETQLVLA
jgi:hypothetical protein